MKTMNAQSKMKYTIPCSWQMYGYLKIQAESLEEAIKLAENDYNLPDGSYVEASFEVDYEVLEE